MSAGTEAAFATALLDPDRPAPGVEANDCRFCVYRNNVIVGLIDGLGQTFPAVRALVGDEFFRAAAREFVREHPPRSPVLIDYGGAFPGWIAAFPPAARVPYLGDVARLEWAWSRTYNAADVARLSAEKIGRCCRTGSPRRGWCCIPPQWSSSHGIRSSRSGPSRQGAKSGTSSISGPRKPLWLRARATRSKSAGSI